MRNSERKALLAFAWCVRNYNPFKSCKRDCLVACQLVDWGDVVPIEPMGENRTRLITVAQVAESLAYEGRPVRARRP